MSFIGAAVIGGVGAIGGSIIGANAAGSAANTQASAANHAADLQNQQYQQQRADQQPWRQAGQTALSQLGDPSFQKTFSMQDFQQEPGYQFRMDQGQQALERSAAARGGLMNGGTLKGLTDYAQGAASNEYQNAYNRFNNDQSQRFNRLSSIAGLGQTANGQLSTAGMNYANQAGSNIANAGAAQAGGQLGMANSINHGISGIGNNAAMYGAAQMFANPAQGTIGSGNYDHGALMNDMAAFAGVE